MTCFLEIKDALNAPKQPCKLLRKLLPETLRSYIFFNGYNKEQANSITEMNKSDINGSLNPSSHNKTIDPKISNDSSACQDYHSQTSTKDVKTNPKNTTWYDKKLCFVRYVNIFRLRSTCFYLMQV